MRVCVLVAMIGLAPFVSAGEPTVSSQNRDKREESPADPTEAPNIDVRLAEAKLKLAEADLRWATEWNRRLRGTIQKSTVEWLQQNVKLANEHVDIARQGKQHWHALHVRQMEATLRTAQSRLEMRGSDEPGRTKQRGQSRPGAVSAEGGSGASECHEGSGSGQHKITGSTFAMAG